MVLCSFDSHRHQPQERRNARQWKVLESRNKKGECLGGIDMTIKSRECEASLGARGMRGIAGYHVLCERAKER
jgi:hypothetical protein